MSISADEVRRIAGLAQLELDDPTAELFRDQLAAILDYVAMLDELQLEHVPPASHGALGGQLPRPDEVAPSLDRADALGAAPDTDGAHFRVPRVLKTPS